MNWPVYKKDLLIIGDLKSPTAICTLWTQRKNIAGQVPQESFAVVGNLYSANTGLDFLVRNVLANPRIRYLIVCGSDVSGSGQALVDFFKNGVEKSKNKYHKECWLVKGRSGGEVDIEVPAKALEILRNNVKLFDLRGIVEPIKIDCFIKQKEFIKPITAWANPQVFPKKQAKTINFPSENSGAVIRGRTVAECWLRILKEVMNFGIISKTQYGSQQKELLDLSAVISQEDAQNPFLPNWLPFDKQHLKNYLPQILTAKSFPDMSYTYGQRMRSYFGSDQVQAVVDKLKKDPETRSAVINLWDSKKDLQSKSPPCLNHVRVRLRKNKLFLTALIRSNDMFRAWPENAFGLLYLQWLMIKGLANCRPGDLTIISGSAHIYDDCWESAENIIKEHWREAVACRRMVRDAKGNFIIYLKNGKIIVEHCAEEGQVLQNFQGDNVQKLMLEISPFVSEIEHAAYLGAELQKAKTALDLGLVYEQDKPLSS